MSGIAGIIRFDGAPVEPGLVQKMTSAMPYRGPDGINHWVKGGVALGQCMLHTTPESLEEHQPLCNEDESLVLVMDGRVDNWEELRRELLGHGAVLRTRADAELVLRAYEAWGRDCLPHIDGDFALAIWEARRQEAFCARDRVGKKPFNYHWDGKTLAFASELHAILALPWVTEDLNQGMLAQFLAAEWFSRDETFWKGILRLVAAHRMVVGASGPRPEQYWTPDLWATLPYSKDEEYVAHYRELFTDVVRRMSRSHLPVAYEVSGGLDSSAIFVMAEKLRVEQKLPAPAIEGYSLKFHDAPAAEELQYSRAVGEHLGVRIHECEATQMPLSWYRESSGRYREFPGYPNGTMSIGLAETACGRGCRALMSGVGGDEWMDTSTGAYYAEELALGHWQDLSSCFKADRRELGIKQSLWWFFRFGVAPLLPDAIKRPLRSIRGTAYPKPRWLSSWLQAEIEERREGCSSQLPARLPRRGQRAQLLTLWRAFDVLASELDERLGSSLGLESRYPFFNKEIVQFAFSTPERLRSRGRITKRLHRQALAGILPGLVLDRTDKAEFTVAFRWHMDRLVDDVKTTILPRRIEWVQPGPARAVCDEYLESSKPSWCNWLLWSLVGCDALLSPEY